MAEVAADDEPKVASATATILRAATIMRDFAATRRYYDYAFGEDGSIGIYSHDESRTEFIDLLNDDRIRYSSRNGELIEQRVLSAEEAALFILSRSRKHRETGDLC
jgi:hypothetical protein